MVNVEADALAGPFSRAKPRPPCGLQPCLGDQPALICEHVDWARACGFKVIAAGKGTRYEPHYHKSNPDNVWDILDKYLNISDRKSINPKMFNSFVDGTKSGIEMTRCATPPGSRRRPMAWGSRRPRASSSPTSASRARTRHPGEGGRHRGHVSVTATASDVPHHLALGTYVVIEGETDTRGAALRNTPCCRTVRTLRRAYRPIHMIGLELGISVASAALRKEPTGAPSGSLRRCGHRQARPEKGEMLDGEGGFCVWGKQTPADVSLDQGYFPLGLAQNVKLRRDIPEGDG